MEEPGGAWSQRELGGPSRNQGELGGARGRARRSQEEYQEDLHYCLCNTSLSLGSRLAKYSFAPTLL